MQSLASSLLSTNRKIGISGQILHKNRLQNFLICPNLRYFLTSFRSSRTEVLCKKDALTNFAKFTLKHLYESLLFNKVADLQALGLGPATLLKSRLWHRCFPENSAKFLRHHFFIEHLWWLLLIVS